MKRGDGLLEIYEDVRSVLAADDISVSNYQLIDYGLQFKVSTLDWSGMIRIYQNKKGIVKIDYSQLRGVNAMRIQNLVGGRKMPSDSREPSRRNTELGFPIIGTDESGKGDYFGPLVSAGVYVDEQTAKALAVYGVKDSKALSDSKNSELAEEIVKICKGRFAIIEISPEKYNDLYEQFKKEKKNLNTLLAWGHAKAIEEILSK